jgi:dihydroflavonol-4-reductase
MLLITGASGFLGRHVVKHFAELGYSIKALYNRQQPSDKDLLQFRNVNWVACDLEDVTEVAAVFEEIQMVIHCAAVVSFDAKDKFNAVYANQQMTANVVNEALECHVQKFVMISSIATLGRNNLEIPLSEKDYWVESKENSQYARGKYLAEMEVWRGIAEGLPAVIINPAIILGPTHNWNEGSSRLMKVCDDNFPFYTEGVNGWVGIHDVVKAIDLLYHSDVKEERYILSEGNHAYKKIFTLMANALGKKPPHIKTPLWGSALLWRWNALRVKLFHSKVSVTKETARTANAKCYYNNEKFLRQFPHFQYTPIEKVIDEMAAAYKLANN